ncbi:MAG: glutathione S-transferase C-terminal domain-containing protein, partial [Gallionella sp.]
VKRWEALADGIMDSAVMVRIETMRETDMQDAATITRHNDAITRALAHIAEQLGTRLWCEGNTITLADLSLTSMLIYLDLRQPDRDWRTAHPNLAKWFAGMSERASVKATLEG